MDNTMTYFDFLNTEVFHPRATIYSLVTMLIEGSSL